MLYSRNLEERKYKNLTENLVTKNMVIILMEDLSKPLV